MGTATKSKKLDHKRSSGHSKSTGLGTRDSATGGSPHSGISKTVDDTLAALDTALCDNEHQGIVKVPAKIGNGDKPQDNLYWGAMYGIKTWFSKSESWEKVTAYKVNDVILERLVFPPPICVCMSIAPAITTIFEQSISSNLSMGSNLLTITPFLISKSCLTVLIF